MRNKMFPKPLAHEFAVNATIFAPGTFFVFAVSSATDLYALLPSLVVVLKLLVIQVLIPGAFAVARMVQRTRRDKELQSQRKQVEHLSSLLASVKGEVDPARKAEIESALRSVESRRE